MPPITIKFRPGSETAKMFFPMFRHWEERGEIEVEYGPSILAEIKDKAKNGGVFTFSRGPGEGIDGAAGVAWGGELFRVPMLADGSVVVPVLHDCEDDAIDEEDLYPDCVEWENAHGYYKALARAEAEINGKEAVE